MNWFLQLFMLYRAGFTVVPLPGVPVDIVPYLNGYAVACTSPGSLCFWRRGQEPEVLAGEYQDPACLVVWNGVPTVSDRALHTITSGDVRFPLEGSPEGICALPGGFLAVCLFQRDEVVLMDPAGGTVHLVRAPGAKSVAPCPGGGLFISGCRSGVLFLSQVTGAGPARPVGNIGSGVKRIAVSDLDGDGLADVAGIACADGGAGWWRNPGDPAGEWTYTELNGELSGTKDIAVRGDSVVVVSLFSHAFTSFLPPDFIPEGFTSCCIGPDGALVMGHCRGFLVATDENRGRIRRPAADVI